MTMTGVAINGLAVLAAAAVLTRVLAEASASVRHLVWTTALGMLVLTPLIGLSGARVELRLPASWLPTAERATGAVFAPEVERVYVAPLGVAAPPAPRAASAPIRGPQVAARSGGAVETDASVTPVAARGGVAEHRAPAEAPRRSAGAAADPRVEPGSGLPSSGGVDVLAGAWAGGVLALLLSTLLGHVGAWRMSAAGVDRPAPDVARRFAALCVESGITRPARLRVSSAIRVPATWGFVRPTIVLPPQHRRWSRETLDRVLLHELAHVERGDCATYLVGELARAVHWPNPLAWYAVRRQRIESEHACDDLVLEWGEGSASEYAADLLALARSLGPGRPLPSAALAMARPSALSRRVRAVLDPEARRGRVTRARVLAAALSATLVCLLTTAVVPVAQAREVPERPSTSVGSEAPDSPRPLPALRSAQAEPTPFAALRPEEAEPALPLPVEPPEPVHPPTPGTTPARAAPQAQEYCADGGEGRRSTSINSDDDYIRIRWETDDCRVEIEMHGEVDFSADDTRVVSMGRGTLFQVEERIRGERRRVRLEGGRNGAVERRFWIDGEEVGWGPEAEAWLARILPELFRHTTINAEARVRRMLADGGPERVFAETDLIHSDHVMRVYLQILMREADLTEREYARVIDAAAGIDSDHTSAELLLSVVAEAGMRDAFQEPMLRAAEGIDSDHQKTRVLQTLLDSDLTSAQFDAVLDVASGIDSDHNLSMVLISVARQDDLSNVGRASFLRAVRTIESDHNRAQVIDALLDVATLPDDELDTVLRMTDGMDSDHQRGRVLQRIAREYELSGRQLEAYLESASRIDSDHELQVTAEVVIDAPAFGPAQLDLVIELLDRVDSDHSKGVVLRSLIRRHELDARQVAAAVTAASRIDSDHELGTTLTTLIEDERLDDRGTLAVLGSAGRIGSSHQRSTVLLTLARRVELEGESRDRYIALAEDLSRHDRDRALAALATSPGR